MALSGLSASDNLTIIGTSAEAEGANLNIDRSSQLTGKRAEHTAARASHTAALVGGIGDVSKAYGDYASKGGAF